MVPTHLHRLSDELRIAAEALRVLAVLNAHLRIEFTVDKTRLVLHGLEDDEARRLFNTIQSLQPGCVLVPLDCRRTP